MKSCQYKVHVFAGRVKILHRSSCWTSAILKYLYPGLNVYSFFACDDFCRLLIAFANSLDPEQDQQNVSLDLDPNGLTP